MSPILFIILALIICAVVYYGFTTYRRDAAKRAHDKRRNSFHDRV